jgi:hypothetical protein
VSKFYLKRTLAGLVADDAEASECLRKIPPGTTVRCEIIRPRNAKELRYYFALCELVASNHAELTTKDQVDQALRILAGHVDLVQVGGKVLRIPKHINFAELGQEVWREYLKRAKDAVVQELLPGVELPEVESEIARMVA